MGGSDSLFQAMRGLSSGSGECHLVGIDAEFEPSGYLTANSRVTSDIML